MRKERLSVIVMALALLIAMIPACVLALTEDVPAEPLEGEDYQYIENIKTSLSISGKIADAGVYIADTNGDTTKLSCSMYLQKHSSGGWSNVASWSKSTNSNRLPMSHTKSVSKGKYRVKSVVKAYKGNRSETITDYSKVKTY